MIRPVHALAVALLGLALLGAGVRPEGLGDVRSIAVEKTASHTRVVIELSRKSSYAVNELASPRRLYLDVDEVWIEPAVATSRTFEGDSALRLVRGGQNTLRRSRIVLELDDAAPRPVISTLDAPFRIVAELPAVVATPESVSAGDAEDWDQRGVRRIVIDAGHGGKDPGAIGVEKAREAAIVLAISRELERELTRRGFEIVMTRKTDVFLPLEARTDIANRRDADLFISVHANAARNRKLAGVETYLLDTRYDRQTARVAARENGTTVAQLSELHKILASLRLGNNERYAARYAELVQHSLVSRLRKSYPGTVDLGVKRGPFLVLFQADMPAILVEVGFVSNPSEGKRLRTTSFARVAAQGIADGVSAYREQQARRLVARR
ncbi:MAG: N-acetylmuramoyl-L-alanine amidase [Myxococcota bacterium]